VITISYHKNATMYVMNKSNYLHHAHILEAERAIAHSVAHDHLTNCFNMTIEGNPDVAILETDRFTIEDARTLKRRAYQAPLGERQVFVLITNSILREAQNALLKLLEEPAQSTHFVLVMPSMHTLLPTVRSRLAYHTHTQANTEEYANAKTFLQVTIKERLDLVQQYIKNKDREGARLFLNTLETYCYKQGIQKNKRVLSEVLFVRNYLQDRASSLKMLLEHLAVSI